MKEFWLSLKKVIFLMSFLCMAMFCPAQQLNVHTEINTIDTNSTAVKVGNVWHALEGVTVKFTLEFVESDGVVINNVVCQFNGMIVVKQNLQDSFEFENMVPTDAETLVANFIVHYSNGTDGSEDIYSVEAKSEEIRIWKTPSCQFAYDEANYLTNDRTLQIDIKGGSDQWKYSWDDGSEEDCDKREWSEVITKPSEGLPKRVDTTIIIKNYAPDGETEWFAHSERISTYFYDEPQIIEEHSIADDLHFYKNFPEGVSWSVVVKGGGDTMVYNWFLNDKLMSSDKPNFRPEINMENEEIKGNIKLQIITYADDDKELWYKECFNEDYIIYPPAALLSDEEITKSVYTGKTVKFSPDYNTGGFPDGNQYEWYDADGRLVGYSKDYEPSTNVAGTYVYMLQSKNMYGDEPWEIYPDQTFTLCVYDQPNVKINTHIDYNSEFDEEYAQTVDSEDISVQLTYDKPTQDSPTYLILEDDIVKISLEPSIGFNMSCTVTDNGDKLSPNSQYEYVLPQDKDMHQLVISIDDDENIEDFFSTKYECIYHRCPNPSATITEGYGDTYETCGGSLIEFSITTDGGDENGWSVQWKKDGKLVGQTSNTYTDEIDYNSGGDGESTESKIFAEVSYSQGGKKRYVKDFSFTIICWPEPQNISDFAIEDVYKRIMYNKDNKLTDDNSIDGATRKGNKLKFMAEKATGGFGNPSLWEYEWTKNGDILNIYTTTQEPWIASFEEELKMDLGPIKTYEDIVYSLTTSNINPTDNSYGAKQTLSKTIRVYNKPETPTALVKKGNGTSGTMIAVTNGLTDADLEAREYYLVFGYEDSDGNELCAFEKQQTNLGDTRFEAQFTSSEVNNPNYNFFVYAKWKYANNVEITSGKRYVDWTNSEWDGSDYTGLTRSLDDGNTSSIVEIPHSSEHSYTRIYTLGGQMVNNSKYLTSGIYIMETLCNGTRTTQKIVVK